jgi:hypothetical protein
MTRTRVHPAPPVRCSAIGGADRQPLLENISAKTETAVGSRLDEVTEKIMNSNARFTILTRMSFISLLLVGVFTAQAQEAPPKSDTDRGQAQTAVSGEPTTQRGDVAPVPQRGEATQGPSVVHPESRPERPPGDSRQTRPSGAQDTQPQSSTSSFRKPISDVQAAIKVLPKDQANVRSKTPCGSPKCQGEALNAQKPFTSQVVGTTGKGSGNVGISKSVGTAGRGRR